MPSQPLSESTVSFLERVQVGKLSELVDKTAVHPQMGGIRLNKHPPKHTYTRIPAGLKLPRDTGQAQDDGGRLIQAPAHNPASVTAPPPHPAST